MTAAVHIINSLYRRLADWAHWFFYAALEDAARVGMMAIQVSIASVGAMFWVAARHQIEAFSEDTWGSFCLRFPAETWAMMMMAQSALIWAGLKDPLKWRWIAVGATMGVIHFSAIAYSAVYTGGEFVIGVWAIALFIPMHMVLAMAAVYRGLR